MNIFKRFFGFFEKDRTVPINNGENIEVESPDITSIVRGQVKYVAYSKRTKIMYGDGIIKRIFGMKNNPQKSTTVIIRHKRRKNTNDVVVVPRSAIVPTNNPNRFWCPTHTSNGVEVPAPFSSYLSLINQNIEQDKEIEAKNEIIKNLINENRRLGKDADSQFDSITGKLTKLGDSANVFLKQKSKGQKNEPYYQGGEGGG